MSVVYAHGRYLKISPTKVRDLMDLIRGKGLGEAETILKFSGRRGGEVALKVLRSAQANAGSRLDKGVWIVLEAKVDKGPIFRRKLDPKPRGARGLITTSSTHLTIGIGPRPEELKKIEKSTRVKKSAAGRKQEGAKDAS